jgi:hypothetical protein
MRTFMMASCGATIMALSACAGRAPQPVAVVQPQDRYGDCLAMQPRSKNSLPAKVPGSARMSLQESLDSSSGLCGLRWIFKGQQARKLLPFKLVNNISEL